MLIILKGLGLKEGRLFYNVSGRSALSFVSFLPGKGKAENDLTKESGKDLIKGIEAFQHKGIYPAEVQESSSSTMRYNENWAKIETNATPALSE